MVMKMEEGCSEKMFESAVVISRQLFANIIYLRRQATTPPPFFVAIRGLSVPKNVYVHVRMHKYKSAQS